MVFLATGAIEIVQEGKLGRNLRVLGRLLLLPSDCGLLQNYVG